MNISKRKIQMFRCYYDPQIGGKSRQAFSKVELPKWDMEMTQIGVYVKWPEIRQGGIVKYHEHLVPFANIQSLKFEPDAEVEVEVANDLQKTA